MEITNHPTTTTTSTVPSSSDPQSSFITAETYVVQIPKDQIYRIPPNENAAIAESRRPPQQASKKKSTSSSSSSCCSKSCYCCVFLGIFIVVVAIIIYLLTFFFQPKNPKFQVVNLFVSTTNHPKTITYRFRVGVRNLDQRSGVSFEKGGQTSLLFMQREIGQGKFPTFHQDKAGASTILVTLTGSNNRTVLPMQVQSSLNGTSKKHVPLVLSMNLLARMRISLLSEGDARLSVVCELVVDTLRKGSTQILSQSCLVRR
ncbi:unnamed protein product [Linum trigynum]|uniref:Late embryogenesis abundant protein LEA-2 subgroup domain-containing protein n=1 Tax=Linum trigynum TaxID=586398 RepID=A0AAV2EXC3_9ROSI